MQVIQKAHPLLLTLVKIQRKYKKDYAWPSQLKIIELLDLRQGIKKSRATLNRWLRVIQDDKYLIRRRRVKKHPVYGLMFKSTLYKITIKGLRLLSRFGVDVSKEIAQYEKWLEEINPDRKQDKIKKILAAADRHDRNEEFMADIAEKLKKNIVAP